jgi:hypothetical protein
VLLLLLRYDPRLVPAFAATVVLMTGVVKAAQAGAWLPFAVDAVATALVAVWLTRYLRREGPPPAPATAPGNVGPRAPDAGAAVGNAASR